MPLITTSHDSLPYIDPEPTPAERTAAQALITASLPTTITDDHPLLPPFPTSTTTSLITTANINKQPNTPPRPSTGIDLSRYESLPSTLPTDTTTTTTTTTNTDTDTSAASETHRQALISATYLRLRQERLQKLEKEGKEEWLGHNESLVKILEATERELAGVREGIDRLANERLVRQEGVRGEVVGLGESWRRGVDRVVEVEIAAEGVRGEVLAARRAGR